ncbi:hypothetical protein [Methylobacterium platani]|uniref:Uncharacterized protein n=1 Tax=Methylobacterium platani TaxID=427683 RepID=A0A179SLQ7_9HYPH|nr:hypothetical protein [Methylobacterium platani]OAS27424.1 hypothetical protein A5481_01280 [Methylobacterium platani]
MSAVIARYLPEFPPDEVPAPVQVKGPAQDKGAAQAPALPSPRAQGANPASPTFGDPWAGLARAPLRDAPEAGPVAPARAGSPDGVPGNPVESLVQNLAEVWREGLHALVAPSSAPPSFAEPSATWAPATRPSGPDPVATNPLVKPPAQKRETPEERAALIAEAEARGRLQGLAEARQEAETARLQAAEAAEARLAEARRHWSEAEAAALADGFSAALRALDAALSDRIARLLVPVLTDALRRRAVAELSGALARLLAEPQAANVRVSGPEDLLAALAARLGPLAAAVSFTPAETAEVQVSADQTVIDTQLGAWTRLIAAAVAET